MPRRRTRLKLALLGLGLLAALPYVGSLSGYFLADDLMLDYFLLEDGRLSLAKLGYHFFPSAGYADRQIYRPADLVLLAVDWFFWSTNPVGYHLTNLAFHVWCTCLVFFLVRRIGRARDLFPAVAGAAFFALHPLSPEAVQWIVGRVDLTSCLFTLLALLGFVRYQATGRARFAAVCVASLALGLLSKDIVVLVPLYLVLHDLCVGWPLRRWRAAWRSRVGIHAAAFGLVAAYFLLRRLCFGSFFGKYEGQGEPFTAGFTARWTEGISQVAALAERILFPIRESVHTPNERAAVWGCLLLGYLGVSVLAVAHGIVARTRPVRRAALFGALWFAATLAPLAYVLLVLPIDADHLNARLGYLPLAAFSVAFPLALFSGEPWRERVWMRLRIAVALIVPVTFVPLTFIYVGLFRQAGDVADALRRQVVQRYREAPPDTPVLLENPPLEMAGVYVLRTGLAYLLRPPFAPVAVPVVALNLASGEELARTMERHRGRPLVLRWHEDGGRIEVVTQSEPAPLPAWSGGDLRGFAARGAVADVETGSLEIRPDRPGFPFAVAMPELALCVPPSDVDSAVVDLRVAAGGPVALGFRVAARDERWEVRWFDYPTGPALEPGVLHRRIIPLRFHLETFGCRRGNHFAGNRWLDRIELGFPAGCERAEILSFRLLRGLPRLTLWSPPDGHRFLARDGAPVLSFRAADGVRYYALVLEIESLGRRRAIFDAWQLNAGRPCRAGDLVRKPADASGNLDPGDFAPDFARVPPNPDGRDLAFTWRIQALAAPEHPWRILAESETRRATIR
ncbi:MAG: hypothetical protein JXQ29_01590 [Planctomycetes bacterium]|nr:hypothetical protein [Planctomycetota bacterium]